MIIICIVGINCVAAYATEVYIVFYLKSLVSSSLIRDLKIDDAVLICMNKKSFLKCGNCNNRLKLILVTFEQFCLAKRCPICYKMDFQNTSHVVAFIAVAQATL